jgi:Family of unknown function (DUF5675)
MVPSGVDMERNMQVAKLQRVYRFNKPTISILSLKEHKVFVLELPNRDNKKQISCIPEGDYICKWILSPKFGWTYQVLDVPNRGNILIHSGNSMVETYGCLLPGMSTDFDLHVWESKKAVSHLFSVLNRESFQLQIHSKET